MKSFAYPLLGLSSLAATVQGAVASERLVRRQELYSGGATSVKSAPVHSVTDLTPKTPGAVRKKIRFGPYTVPGSKEPSIGAVSDKDADKFGAIEIKAKIDSICGGDCYLLQGVGVPEYENGTALSATGSIYNHHVFALNQDRQVSPHICPGDSYNQMRSPGVVINSQTDTEWTIYTTPKVKTGLAIRAADNIQLLAEFMNYREEKQTVLLTFDLEYMPGKPAGYMNSQQMMFSATPCKDLAFTPPTKQFTLMSKDYKVSVDMTLINARGHQHDGNGTGMQVFLNGKEICNAKPEYVKVPNRSGNDKDGFGIKEMSLCDTPVPMKKGDIFTMKSDYDTEKYPQRESNGGNLETVAAMLSVVLGLPQNFNVSDLG